MYKVLNDLIYYKASKKEAPLIIICRGGSSDFFLWDRKHLKKALNYPSFHVVAFDYPDGEQYGGKVDLDFIKQIPELLKEKGVKFSSIGVVGISRGGLMAYILLKDCPWVKAAVIKSGISDMRELLNYRPDLKKYLPSKFKFNKKELDNRSPILWADEIKAPVLVIHGDRDERVPFPKIKLPNFKIEKVPDGDHRLENYPIKEMVNWWFKKHL